MKKYLILCLALCLIGVGLSSALAEGAPELILLDDAAASIEDENVHFWYKIGDDVAAEFLSNNNNLTKLFTVSGVEAEDMTEYLQYKEAGAEDNTYVTGTPVQIGNYEVRGLGADKETPTSNTVGYRVEAPQVMLQNDTYEQLYSADNARVAEYTDGIKLTHERVETSADEVVYTVSVTGTLKKIDGASIGLEGEGYFFPWQVKGVSKEVASITSSSITANGDAVNTDGMDGFTMQDLFKIGDMVISDPFLFGILPIGEDSSLTVRINYDKAPALVYEFDLTGLTLE